MNYVGSSGHRQTSIYDKDTSEALSERKQQILNHQNDTKARKSGETFCEWKIRIAKMSGAFNLCVRETTRDYLRSIGIDPDEMRNRWDNFWFPTDAYNKDIIERTNRYLRFLLDEESIPDTEETYQIRLTVHNILADTAVNGHSVNDASDRFINEVYVHYFTERVGYAKMTEMLMLTVGSMVAQRAVEKYWTGKVVNQNEAIEEDSNTGSGSWEAQTPRTGEEWNKYFQDTYGTKNVHWKARSFEHMVENPQSFYGATQKEIAQALGEGWTAGSYGDSGTGWKFINDKHPDLMVFYHNADGVH